MSGTPDWLRNEVVAYYQATTEQSYLTWGGASLALHLGLTDDGAIPADRRTLDASLLAMNDLLAWRAGIGDRSRVLDAGCGVGGSSLWLARERGASVVGITLDPRQVELARGFAAERSVTNVRFEAMDFAATTFAEASFDVVWNLESLCHVGEPRAYLDHVRHLLADRGRFVCADFFRGQGGPACDEMCAGWVLPELQRPSDVVSTLTALGYDQIDWVDLTPRVLPSASWMATTATFETLRLEVATMSGAPPRPSFARHFHAAAAASRGLANGEIVYGLVSAVRPGRA
jgi:tocopherol O-methyltransferase